MVLDGHLQELALQKEPSITTLVPYMQTLVGRLVAVVFDPVGAPLSST